MVQDTIASPSRFFDRRDAFGVGVPSTELPPPQKPLEPLVALLGVLGVMGKPLESIALEPRLTKDRADGLWDRGNGTPNPAAAGDGFDGGRLRDTVLAMLAVSPVGVDTLTASSSRSGSGVSSGSNITNMRAQPRCLYFF